MSTMPPEPPSGGGYAPPPPPGYGGAPQYGGAPGGAQLASFGQRLTAGSIDYLLPGVLANIFIRINGALGMLVWLAGLAFTIYSKVQEGKTGVSVGKGVAKIRTIGEATGQPIGAGSAILRWLLHIIDGIICGIGYLFPLWDAKKQTIADKIMKTVVVQG